MSTNPQLINEYHSEIIQQERHLKKLSGDELSWRRELVAKALGELVALEDSSSKGSGARAQKRLDEILGRLKHPTDRERIR